MVAAASIQKSNVEGVKQSYFQSASDKIAPAAKAAQNAAKTVFSFCTNPLVVYFVASNAVLARSFGTSLPAMMAMNTGSSLAGLSAAVLVSFCKAKVTGKPEITVTIEKMPEPTESLVIPVTSKNYKTEVLASKTPVILDAYANWCPPCKRVAPLYAELSKEMSGKIKFVKLNVDEESSLAKELDIQAMPTFLIFKDGKIVDRHEGAMDKNAFLTKFVQYLV